MASSTLLLAVSGSSQIGKPRCMSSASASSCGEAGARATSASRRASSHCGEATEHVEPTSASLERSSVRIVRRILSAGDLDGRSASSTCASMQPLHVRLRFMLLILKGPLRSRQHESTTMSSESMGNHLDRQAAYRALEVAIDSELVIEIVLRGVTPGIFSRVLRRRRRPGPGGAPPPARAPGHTGGRASSQLESASASALS